MPDDNQNPTIPTSTDSSGLSGTTNFSATNDAATDATADAAAEAAAANLDFAVPSLDDVEYATPSAYIDPDLPATPTSIDSPDAPAEETPAEDVETLEMTPEQIAEAIKASNAVMAKVAEKVANSRNILIATSSDPSVDELAAAISLSMFLDRLGKHAIAIYSGKTPDALGFLHPDQTFETDADVLQDFVISISKEKADHLRYRLDGDFVKIFITPYKDKIAAEDLEFSYGDYNIDLVLALNVDNGVDLDAALREHGRIMHDATVVNITTGNPGKFGEIEWNNRHASSISEMISELLLNATGDTTLNADEATALLTGIVAATDRFARANTFPTTMQTASRLLEAGANQQLVAENISDDLDNQFYAFSEAAAKAKKSAEPENGEVESYDFSFTPTEEPKDDTAGDDTALKISHGDEESPSADSAETATDSTETTAEETTLSADSSENNSAENNSSANNSSEINSAATDSPESAATDAPAEDSALLDELKATEASLSGIGAEVVSENSNPGNPDAPESSAAPEATSESAPETLNPAIVNAPAISATPEVGNLPEMNFGAPADLSSDATSKYSQMLEDALNEPATQEAAPMASALPPDTTNPAEPNPAATTAPEVTNTPEVNNLPEINYGQTSDQVLPPPPAPPVDLNSPMPMPVASEPAPAPGSEIPASPETPVPPEVPASPETPATPPSPDTFTIPGI